MSAKIVITGGGTGGHVFPALAIAEELQSRGNSILYIGSDRGLEAKLAPQKAIRFVAVKTGPVKNQKLTRLIKTFWQLGAATLWAIRLLRREKVQAVVGVGGYISVPICLAGFVLRLPIFLQEQNVSVGLANRLLGRLSRRIFLGFPEAQKYFSLHKCVFTGNPIRKEFFQIKKPYNPKGKTLLVLGGSQGARSLNQVITQNLHRLPKGLKIIHQTGVTDVKSVEASYRDYQGDVQVTAFIEDIAETMAQATVVVSRSGALTVSELIEVGRPSLLVPFPRQGQNDQTDNARWLARAGGAEVVEQGAGFSERFWDCWDKLFRPDRLDQMASSFAKLRRPPALEEIGNQIQEELQQTVPS